MGTHNPTIDAALEKWLFATQDVRGGVLELLLRVHEGRMRRLTNAGGCFCGVVWCELGCGGVWWGGMGSA